MKITEKWLVEIVNLYTDRCVSFLFDKHCVFFGGEGVASV